MADLNSLSGVLGEMNQLGASNPAPKKLDLNAQILQQTAPLQQLPGDPNVLPPTLMVRGKPVSSSGANSSLTPLQQATQNDLELQKAAQENAPNNDGQASAISALAAVGNIAGAVTGRGDLGKDGLVIAEQMRQEGRQAQDKFYARVKADEAGIATAQAAADQIKNDRLIGDSLKPLLRTLKDPKEQAYGLQLINSGRGKDAQQWLYTRIQQIRENQIQDMNQSMKRTEFQTGQIIAHQKIAETGLDLTNKTAGDFTALTPGEQRVQFQKQTNEYQDRIKKQVTPLQQFQEIDQILGGVDTSVAVNKLSRLTGLAGNARGNFKAFGTTEDKALYQAINRFVTTAKTEDFGSQFPDTEKYMAEAGMGFTLGERTFGNMTRSPEALASSLQRFRDELRAKISNAEKGIDPAVLTRLSSDGRPTSSLQSFEAHLQANKDLGGLYSSLDVLPPQLANKPNAQEQWLQMSPIQKKQLLIQIKRLGQ